MPRRNGRASIDVSVDVKDVVFISHANPEDNAFTRWLSLRLASLGYRVWSDVTQLLGGEDFWRDIEKAIREDTVKFLYVLSRPSNQREGSLLELKVAHDVRKRDKLHDFIIPLRVDDLPFNEINIQLSNLIAIDFSNSWADVHQRVHRVVHLYADPIRRTADEDERADVWFVVIPDIVYERCRPKSIVPDGLRIQLPTRLSAGMAKKLKTEHSMFNELNEDAAPYQYEPHFRNQLKAVLLDRNTPTQVVRETTLTPHDFLNKWGHPQRRIGGASEVAWNLSSTAFYKSGARPWKVADVRQGVCYLGVVFKRRRWSVVILRRADVPRFGRRVGIQRRAIRQRSYALRGGPNTTRPHRRAHY